MNVRPPPAPASANGRWRSHLLVTGVVQGVGFRPFVHRLAAELDLGGWVRNSSAGVEIEVEGAEPAVQAFIGRLGCDAPPASHIDRLIATGLHPLGETRFTIRDSIARSGAFQPVSPDLSTCDACLDEVLDPANRRFGYPFTNCTDCGPRFTIIRDLPYDRPLTTMAAFEMCPSCQAEYEDPTDRRYHAQPNACPECGPRVWLEASRSPERLAEGAQAIEGARRMLGDGAILAIKGLGGFHLACDARNEAAVARLRLRKGRVGKPFALMARNLAAVSEIAEVSPAERRLLASRERPIVLLRRVPGGCVAAEVAPGNDRLGIMLPYTPLHALLFAPGASYDLLVMTSGNRAEEPIVTENEVARRELVELADALLLHDREIHVRCDDSVTRIALGRELPVRRSRGYAPYPVRLPFPAPPILACGAEMKNTFCLSRDDYAFLSQHIGDMENYETLCAYEAAIDHSAALFRVRPAAVAHDLHPDYLATRYALGPRAGDLLRLGVQHHHAHIAACMAENGLPEDRTVIGLAFDGTGYGLDGSVWGGEALVASYASFERAAHLRPVVLPGGDAAARHPWRMALAWLWAAGVPWGADLAPVRASTDRERRIVQAQLEGRVPSVTTTSMGRLFDAISSLAGVCQMATYEAQAAIELEAIRDPSEPGAYPFDVSDGDAGGPIVLDPGPAVAAIASEVLRDTSGAVISARFHRTVAAMALAACQRIRQRSGADAVCLSGGVFQNASLLELVTGQLEHASFDVYSHHLVPPNDGGLALGQLAVAAARLRAEGQMTMATERTVKRVPGDSGCRAGPV